MASEHDGSFGGWMDQAGNRMLEGALKEGAAEAQFGSECFNMKSYLLHILEATWIHGRNAGLQHTLGVFPKLGIGIPKATTEAPEKKQ